MIFTRMIEAPLGNPTALLPRYLALHNVALDGLSRNPGSPNCHEESGLATETAEIRQAARNHEYSRLSL